MRLKLSNILRQAKSLLLAFFVNIREASESADTAALLNDAKRMLEAVTTLKDAMSDAYRELSLIQKRISEQIEDDE